MNGFYAADARDLNTIKDAQFDASLMLGPMYHLQQENERIKAIKELNRVTKKKELCLLPLCLELTHFYIFNYPLRIGNQIINMDSINSFF